MIYGSVCSGIEAATVAWGSLGFRATWFAETDPAPSAVLAHHHPGVPNRGDFTTIEGEAGSIDVLVGGTPCQDFSVAGLRAGLAGDRGNLTLEFLRLADRLRPVWVVWENVPGVLSIDGGRAFGAFLGGLVQLGYGWAYRVLDAQHFGVPQRRRRVFVVGHLGDRRRAAAVLFDRNGLSGNPPPRREAGQGLARCLASGPNASQRLDGTVETLIPTTAPTLFASNGGASSGYHSIVPVPFIVNAAESCARANHARESETARCLDSTGSFANAQGGTVVMQPTPIDMRQASRGATMTNNRAEGSSGGAPGTGIGEPGDPAPSLSLSHPPAIAFVERGRDGGRSLEWQEDLAYSQMALDGGGATDRFQVATRSAVRRLTPLECERLMGFPDDFTLVPYRGKMMADGSRYKMLGNSMAVPVMRWIGERIMLVGTIPDQWTKVQQGRLLSCESTPQ